MAYVKNAWYVAAWSCDLSPSAPFAISILGEPIVLWRSESGLLSALEDRCVHRFAPLSIGRCEGERLRCMYHGLLYAPSGHVVEIPGQDIIPSHARIRSFPVVDRHDWIWIWMGDPALADDTLIPPAVGISDPDWVLGHGYIDYQAEARLVCDNLLDFSHLSFVHAKSFGAGPEFAQQQPRITQLDRGVRVSRWMSSPVGSARNPHNVAVEAYQSYDFLIPGVLLMWSANFSEGTSQRLGDAAPAMEDALSGLNFTSQAVTATGTMTARYFFSWGPHGKHGGVAQRDKMMAMAATAFAEDRVMIEAQQRVMSAAPHRNIMPTAHDKGVTLYNRLVERMVGSQSSQQEAAA